MMQSSEDSQHCQCCRAQALSTQRVERGESERKEEKKRGTFVCANTFWALSSVSQPAVTWRKRRSILMLPARPFPAACGEASAGKGTQASAGAREKEQSERTLWTLRSLSLPVRAKGRRGVDRVQGVGGGEREREERERRG